MFNRIDRPIETTIIEPQRCADRMHDPDPSVHVLPSFRLSPLNRWKVINPTPGFTSTSSITSGRTTTVSCDEATNDHTDIKTGAMQSVIRIRDSLGWQLKTRAD